MLLITEPGDQRRDRPEDEGRVLYDKMVRFREDLRERGLLIGCESLRSDVEGVRVRVRNGKRELVDGPFSESKEIVGGFYLVDCATRAEAVAIAEACPAVEWATVEVRGFGACFEQ